MIHCTQSSLTELESILCVQWFESIFWKGLRAAEQQAEEGMQVLTSYCVCNVRT